MLFFFSFTFLLVLPISFFFAIHSSLHLTTFNFSSILSVYLFFHSHYPFLHSFPHVLIPILSFLPSLLPFIPLILLFFSLHSFLLSPSSHTLPIIIHSYSHSSSILTFFLCCLITSALLLLSSSSSCCSLATSCCHFCCSWDERCRAASSSALRSAAMRMLRSFVSCSRCCASLICRGSTALHFGYMCFTFVLLYFP